MPAAAPSPSSMPDLLAGRTALVTGASSGLGRHCALVLARAGARVAITGRRVERLEALCEEIAAFDGRALPLPQDITDAAAIPRLIDQAETELGPVTILLNNAGLNVQGRLIDQTPESFDAIMATNLRGAFFMATEIARRLIDRGEQGRIINMASIGADTVLPGLGLYCTSKAAVAMMTRSMAYEWARYGINVNALAPGFIETELNDTWFASDKGQAQIRGFPRRRLMEAQDLDGLLLLLASDASRAITGAVLTIDDGQSLGGMG